MSKDADQPGYRDALADTLDKPSPARIYDYWLGGTTNYAVDRMFADAQAAKLPAVRVAAWENRMFLRRATRYARAEGVTQFVDVGSGLPTAGNVHEIADESGAGAKVVYVDNDPIVKAHSDILLADTADPGRHRALYGDFTAPMELWDAVTGLELIDPARPVCLIVSALLHFIRDEQKPDEIMTYLRTQLPAGSLLVLSHATDVGTASELDDIAKSYKEATSDRGALRNVEEIKQFVGEWAIVEPGVVWTCHWRPDLAGEGEEAYEGDPADTLVLGLVARKPAGVPQ